MPALDVLILAAGKGTRMKSDLPKVLHRVMGEPLLRHVVDAARALRPRRIGIIVGHRRELVVEEFQGDKSLAFVVQEEQKGTGHAIRCAQAKFARGGGHVMVLSGDVPLMRPETLHDLYRSHLEHDVAASVLTAVLDAPGSLGRIVRGRSGRLEKIVEARDATPEESAVKEINSGIYVFKKEALFAGLKKLEPHPPSGEFYLTDVVKDLVLGGRKVHAEIIMDPTEAFGINTRAELAEAHRALKARILEEHAEKGVIIVDPPTTYIAKGAVIGPGTVILPFSVISGAVNLGARCRIGPFAHLRPGTTIADGATIGNFVEVKNSAIGAGTAVCHLSYLGDATIGSRVNVGAGTITANFDGATKHVAVVEDDAKLGAGVVLIAPVRVGRRSVVGAGAVVTARHDVPEGTTVVGAPARALAAAPPKAKERKRAASPRREDQGTRVRRRQPAK